MSVPEPKSKADERVEKILSRIAELKVELDKYKPPEKKEIPSATKEEDPYEHVHSCPTCKAKLDKEISDRSTEETAKAFKERAKYPLQCEGCGLGVKIEETTCPGCGGKRAKERRY